MLVHVVCETCGGAFSFPIEDETDLPNCPRCDGRLLAEEEQGEEFEHFECLIDDEIASWVSLPLEATPKLSKWDAFCPRCGWPNALSFDSHRGDSLCPNCLADFGAMLPDTRRTVDCPGCGQSVEYSDRDRGRTIICRACRYFLGCLIPPEKHRYRTRRRSGLR